MLKLGLVRGFENAGGVPSLYDLVDQAALPPVPTAALQYPRSNLAGTEWVDASTGFIDFVSDCGADPTGVVDASAAWNTAMQLLMQLALSSTVPKYSLTLFLPPGKYKLATNFGLPYDFNGSSTSVRIVGSGQDSSFIEFGAGINAPSLLNLYGFHLEALTFIGLESSPSPDVAAGFAVSCFGPASMCNVRFANIISSTYVLIVQGQGWELSNVLFTNCATLGAFAGSTPTAGVAQSTARTLLLDNVQFDDVGAVNGYSTANKTAVNQGPAWLHVGSGTLTSGDKTRLVEARGCFFDEGNKGGLWVLGTAGAPNLPVGLVRVIGCNFNPSALADGRACLHCEIVDHVVVEGLLDTGFTAASVSPAVELVAVAFADVSGVEIDPAANSNSLVADAASGVVRIKDSPTLIATNILTAAALCEVEQNFVGVVNAGVTVTLDTAVLANTLVKFFAEVSLLGSSNTASLPSQAVFKNFGGVALATAVGGSTNPADSGDASWLAAHPVTSELSGGAPSISVWSVSGANARLSITNNDPAQNARYQATIRRRIAA